jgi:hypothetical protein
MAAEAGFWRVEKVLMCNSVVGLGKATPQLKTSPKWVSKVDNSH